MAESDQKKSKFATRLRELGFVPYVAKTPGKEGKQLFARVIALGERIAEQKPASESYKKPRMLAPNEPAFAVMDASQIDPRLTLTMAYDELGGVWITNTLVDLELEGFTNIGKDETMN